MTLLAPEDQLPSIRKNFTVYLPLLGYVALVFLVAATAYYSFWKMEGVLEEEKLRDLGAIADTKAGQIGAWREVQKRIGEGFAEGSLLADEFGRWQEQGMPPDEHKYHIRQLLSELQYVNGYKTLLLLDRKGVARISAHDVYVPDAEAMRLAAQAMDSRKVVFSDFHRNNDGSQEIYIDLIVPLITSKKTGQIVGAAILVIDPHTFLYPLIQSWPTRRDSAETLLVRREGKEVLFLNELHHGKDSALSLHVPLDLPNLPAAMAVRGETGTTDGVDYRGVAVVAAMREIPGTPWFMVAKVDKAELFAPINQLKTWAAGLGFVVALLGGGLFFVWLRGAKARYRLIAAQRDAALEREMLVKHFEYLTRYASDIILVADETGRIVEANECALEAYGYTREELLRMRVPDLRLPTEDPAILEGQLERLKEQGELRYETVSLRKDGTAFPLEASVRIIEIQGAKYLHGIGRDITVRKHAEDILRRSEVMLRESRMAQIGSWELDLVNNVLSWSDENYRIFETDRTLPKVTYETFLNAVHPDDRPMVNQAYTDSVKNRAPYDIVHRLLFPEQRVKYVREWCETFYDPEGSPIRSIGTTQDVTVQKLVEEALRASESRYRLLIESSPFCIHEIDLEGRLQSMNRAGLDMLGLDDAGKICGMPYLDAVSRQDAGRVGALLQDAIAGIPSHFEFAAAGAAPLYFKSCFIPLKDANGKVLKLMGVTEDITGRRQAGDLLQQQKNFIRQVVDTDPNMIFVRDAGGKFLLANRAMATLHGMETQELAGRNVAELFPDEEQLNVILRTDGEVIEKRSPIEFVEHHFLGGKSRWFRITKVPMEQPDGSVHVLGIAVDITESKLAAEKLLQSAMEIEDLYDNAPCGYHSLDKDGVFVRINKTELEWLGYDRGELVGQRSFPDMLAPSGSEKFYPWFHRLKEKGGGQELELEVLRRDGTVFPVLLNATAIYDSDGHFLMSRATMFDVTTHRLAEVALRESENLFRTTVDNVPVIIWVADIAEGQDYQGCNFVSQRWYDFTGSNREEMLACDWISYIHPDDVGRCLDIYNEAFRQVQPFKLEYRLRRHDGIYRWMLDSGVPRFTAEGDFAGYIGTRVDMTEQKQFEKLRAEMEHVGRLNIAGEMASGLAHELSQPLTACNNYLESCLRRMDGNDWDREKLHQVVQLAHKQAERAGKIINHLKEMVRKQGHERAPVDVNLLVKDTLAFLASEVERQGVSVHMALSPLPQIMACRVEIEQVLLNLCKNAVESMHASPRRELHVSTCVIESGEILVTVSDSGKGISPSAMENLFNLFQTSKRDGLGLGLAICRSFVENHGGRIWAESQQESGTEFNFTLLTGADHE